MIIMVIWCEFWAIRRKGKTPAVNVFLSIERFSIVFTANDKYQIRVYVSSNKLSELVKIQKRITCKIILTRDANTKLLNFS